MVGREKTAERVNRAHAANHGTYAGAHTVNDGSEKVSAIQAARKAAGQAAGGMSAAAKAIAALGPSMSFVGLTKSSSAEKGVGGLSPQPSFERHEGQGSSSDELGAGDRSNSFFSKITRPSISFSCARGPPHHRPRTPHLPNPYRLSPSLAHTAGTRSSRASTNPVVSSRWPSTLPTCRSTIKATSR